jgi:hypothetical protein
MNKPIHTNKNRGGDHNVILTDARKQRGHQHSGQYAEDRKTREEAEGVEEKAEGLIELEDLVEAEEVEHEAVDGEHCCWMVEECVGGWI